MVSDELANLSDALLAHAARGEVTPPETMALFAAIVLDLSKRVRAMEDMPIPLIARLPLDDDAWIEDEL